jgi:hypothetical protein
MGIVPIHRLWFALYKTLGAVLRPSRLKLLHSIPNRKGLTQRKESVIYYATTSEVRDAAILTPCIGLGTLEIAYTGEFGAVTPDAYQAAGRI